MMCGKQTLEGGGGNMRRYFGGLQVKKKQDDGRAKIPRSIQSDSNIQSITAVKDIY